MLREELHEQCSYVGGVVRFIDNKKVLVKVIFLIIFHGSHILHYQAVNKVIKPNNNILQLRTFDEANEI